MRRTTALTDVDSTTSDGTDYVIDPTITVVLASVATVSELTVEAASDGR